MLGAFFSEFDPASCGGRRPRWGFEGFGENWWGGPGRGRGGHWRGRAARLFEQGDLKYVILRMLEEKPRHGYAIIKELESRFRGTYAPSPGTVYPTLTMLEDLGFARVVPEEGGKKIYEITDEGRKHLAEHSTTVNDIFDRIARFVAGFSEAPMTELNHAFGRLARVTYATATAHISDKDRIEALRKIIKNAADEIDAIGK